MTYATIGELQTLCTVVDSNVVGLDTHMHACSYRLASHGVCANGVMMCTRSGILTYSDPEIIGYAVDGVEAGQ